MVEQFNIPGLPRRPGRPKTNPLSRNEQKRLMQRERKASFKAAGLRQIVAWLPERVVASMDKMARDRKVSREKFVADHLEQMFRRTKTRKIKHPTFHNP